MYVCITARSFKMCANQKASDFILTVKIKSRFCQLLSQRLFSPHFTPTVLFEILSNGLNISTLLSTMCWHVRNVVLASKSNHSRHGI
jgi:hypothetical protein